MKKWKIGLVGCGDIAWGSYLAEMHRVPKADVVAVCDIIPERAKEYAAAYNVPNWYGSVDEMLEKCDFEILMDVASIQSHHEINMKALKAGKHLYSQKPIGLTVAEVNEQIAAAKEANVRFSASPIHMLRPEIKNIKKMVKKGAIGKVTMIRARASHGGPEYFQYRTADPTWFHRPGAGALYDLGVHALHQVTGILGPAKLVGCMAAITEPERLARSGTYDGMKIRADEIPDNYLITMDFGGGALGIVDTGYVQRDSKMPSLEVYGTLGVITLSTVGGWKSQIDVYFDSPERGVRGWMTPMPQERPEPQFFQCWAVGELIEAIEGDRPSRLTPEHARHVIDIICTIPEAINTGRILPVNSTF